jgi:hypothetical protein
MLRHSILAKTLAAKKQLKRAASARARKPGGNSAARPRA